MSLILDALRKMEQDKSSRRGSAQDLRPEVLRYRRAPAPQRSFPVLPVLVGVVLLVGGIGTALVLKSHRASDVAASGPAAPASVAVQQAPIAPAPLSVPAPAAPAPAVPAPAPVASAPIDAPVRPAVSEAAPTKRDPEPAAKGKRSRAETQPPAAEPSVKPARRAAPVQAALQPMSAGGGDITISGIAWQDERSMRRAVLNGSLVGEGATVAGARVVEIKEDRVRLSRNGQLFEVALSSAAGVR